MSVAKLTGSTLPACKDCLDDGLPGSSGVLGGRMGDWLFAYGAAACDLLCFLSALALIISTVWVARHARRNHTSVLVVSGAPRTLVKVSLAVLLLTAGLWCLLPHDFVGN